MTALRPTLRATLRAMFLLAVVLGATSCASRDMPDAATSPDQRQPGSGPGFYINGNTQFFGGSTWYH